MAEADYPHGVGAVEILNALFEMDTEVLNGIVIVHVDGYIKIHAANGVHQRFKAGEVHGNGVVHRDAQLIGHHLRQLGHAALAEGGVDLVGFSIPYGLGVTGDADAIDIAVHRVHGY